MMDASHLVLLSGDAAAERPTFLCTITAIASIYQTPNSLKHILSLLSICAFQLGEAKEIFNTCRKLCVLH